MIGTMKLQVDGASGQVPLFMSVHFPEKHPPLEATTQT